MQTIDDVCRVPHIHEYGARYHTPSWGVYCSMKSFGDFTAEWCSEPFCENNIRAVKSLIEHGHSADSCPLPRLRDWLKEHGGSK